MKTINTFLIITLLSIGLKHAIIAQTYVSGGIYSNTTWTAANSPYIVTDTIVVFPGFTLTIQPGVVVKFNDSTLLEIRHGKLIAIGTINDSITFTSNSSNPVPSIWNKIYLNNSPDTTQFSYCKVLYSLKGINGNRIIIKHSKFFNNYSGIVTAGILANIDSCEFKNNIYSGLTIGEGKISNCNFYYNQTAIENAATGGVEGLTIKNCIINNNYYGLSSGSGDGDGKIFNSIVNYNKIGILIADSVVECEIKNDSIGLWCWVRTAIRNIIENNYIGVEGYSNNIHCNRIRNNFAYDFYYNVLLGSVVNINMSNNDWGTTDSSIIASHIYDGYDNVALGLVTFMPIDTLQCYQITNINEMPLTKESFYIFPNPSSDKICIKGLESYYNYKIYDITGKTLITGNSNSEQNIDISNLTQGIHFIKIYSANKIETFKIIKNSN